MPKLTKQQMLQEQTWERLNNNIIKYSRLKIDIENIKAEQDSLKKEIIGDMDVLGIKKQITKDASADAAREISCTLVEPAEVNYNLNTVKADYPKCVESKTVLSLDDDEHIAAFKIKLKELGLTDNKIRKLINEAFTITKAEKVDELKFKRKIDSGDVEDISKYATIIQKPKYIRVTEKEVNV